MNHCLIFNVFPFQAKRPGGAHRIASFLRENEWDAEVIDWAAEWSLEELKELIKSRTTSNTKFIGFSCFFSEWTDTLEDFTSWLKQSHPTIPLVLGSQSRPRMDSKFIDYYITGYGERAILELIKVFTGNSLAIINYDQRFEDKKVIVANHSYPSYPMKSLMIKYEKRDYIEPHEWLTVEYSRGCMFKCLYCNFPVLGVKGDYTRDADDYVKQLQESYDQWGVTKYICADETFNDRTDKIIKFADATEKLSFTPYVSGFIRADLLISRPQDWEHLLRMRFLGQYYGVESMHWPSAKSIGKGMKPEKLQEGLLESKDWFQKNSENLFRGHISLIAGLPHETEETLEKTVQWCENNWSGSGAEIWPLEIPMNSTLDVPSLLTSKWKEFGYREADNNPFVVETGVSMVENDSLMGHGIINLNWETDHLTLNRVQQLCKEYQERFVKAGMGIGNLALQEFSYCLSLEDTLKLQYGKLFKNKSVREWIELGETNLKNKIKNYIRNKLSL